MESNQNDNNDDDDSAHEALMELLGLASMEDLSQAKEPPLSQESNTTTSTTIETMIQQWIETTVNHQNMTRLRLQYQQDSVVCFPSRVHPTLIQRWTNELVWGGYPSDRTYETIPTTSSTSTSQTNGNVVFQRSLTRLENFVNGHDEWNKFSRSYIPLLLQSLFGEPYVLFKEKINLKPPGGNGFAPHLDGPSLRVALSKHKHHTGAYAAPTTFVTVMVAIDAMTIDNGCLRLHTGPWTETNCVDTIPPVGTNPDAEGRAGALSRDVADAMEFTDLVCEAGTIAVFGAWTPHRSSRNNSPFHRRAVFLTYNPLREGDFHDEYYEEMARLRGQWRQQVGLKNSSYALGEDEKLEMEALSTIPKI